jgi:hypothetical protein
LRAQAIAEIAMVEPVKVAAMKMSWNTQKIPVAARSWMQKE